MEAVVIAVVAMAVVVEAAAVRIAEETSADVLAPVSPTAVVFATSLRNLCRQRPQANVCAPNTKRNSIPFSSTGQTTPPSAPPDVVMSINGRNASESFDNVEQLHGLSWRACVRVGSRFEANRLGCSHCHVCAASDGKSEHGRRRCLCRHRHRARVRRSVAKLTVGVVADTSQHVADGDEALCRSRRGGKVVCSATR